MIMAGKSKEERFKEEVWGHTKLIADAYNRRGLAYRLQGLYAEAIADYTKAIELNPHAAVYRNRGRAYLKLGNKMKAKEDYETCEKLIEESKERIKAKRKRT